MSKDMFWEDQVQAEERLSGTYLLHGDDVVHVRAIQGMDDGQVGAHVTRMKDKKVELIPLSDPKFHRFRRLPPIGWVNNQEHQEGVFAMRRPVRARRHGLSDENVSVGRIERGGYQLRYDKYRYSFITADKGYDQACKDDYPALTDVLAHIREGSTMAVSAKYATVCDENNLSWLYRDDQRVGLFAGKDSLLLMGKHAYLREELTESPVITVENIREF